MDFQIEAALERGRHAREQKPRARGARHDRRSGRDVVTFNNGCAFGFPPCLAQGLEAAAEERLAQVAVLGAGTGLHWEVLDVDLSVAGLLLGLFGTRAHIARLAGQARSPAKAAAARGATWAAWGRRSCWRW